MTFQEMAMRMYECWLAGAGMLYLVKTSKHKKLLRIDKQGILKFLKVMAFITAARVLILNFLTPAPVVEGAKAIANFLPLGAVPFVFWEDACHTLPLVLAEKTWADTKWYKWIKWPALVLMMVSFGSGHAYQGSFAMVALAFYIPFTMKLGKKYGFGTVMLCHIMYDMLTLLTIRYLV